MSNSKLSDPAEGSAASFSQWSEKRRLSPISTTLISIP